MVSILVGEGKGGIWIYFISECRVKSKTFAIKEISMVIKSFKVGIES